MTELVDGLRALELLARLVPIEVEGFARAAEIEAGEAAELIETFVATGFVSRVPHGSLLVLTPMALGRVFTHNLIGNLAARGIERIGDLSAALGGACITLSIRRGAQMLRVLASQPREVGARTAMLESVEGQVHAAFSGERNFGKADLIREAGFGFAGAGEAATLAVPILVQRRPVAVLAAHFEGVMPPEATLRVLQATAREWLNASGELAFVMPAAPVTFPAVLH